MTQPIPGSQYTVETGEDLEDIAVQAYGDSTEANRIFKANQGTVKSADWKFVQAGTKINIPIIPELEELRDIQTGG
jgi:nucleoid-associated protein YgaU